MGNSRYSLPPVLNGEIYCSPWCGCRCKKADFDRANENAEALAQTMGDGWQPHVWENGGWHWRAVKGESKPLSFLAEIHPYGDGTYTAWINSGVDGIGQVITGHHADPVEALGMALQEARGRVLRYSGELDSISA